MRAVLLSALLPLSLLVPACSPQAAEQTAAPVPEVSIHPISGLEVVPLSITSSGKTHRFRVEMARTPQQQAQGLMQRETMGADEGMLFPYAQPHTLSFWMKDTILPLDIIFIGTDDKIVNIAAKAVPFSEEPIVSDGPAVAVLELNGGRAAQLGIKAGDTVSW
ncbi:conserved hypothetical protein [Altererythrobacter sp. B11]|uniref:DUF192 domain-containing protein n=1 Tax=Altererythrobacter sp. B11 TaxID=2060312 RepID=UPI000DC712DC|nr:DUF192 domain-containing protein [Altererythrobacter sp. B11]BBC71876.1 conserved hypothetical protein [Altererythrobacter sp. B11]